MSTLQVWEAKFSDGTRTQVKLDDRSMPTFECARAAALHRYPAREISNLIYIGVEELDEGPAALKRSDANQLALEINALAQGLNAASQYLAGLAPLIKKNGTDRPGDMRRVLNRARLGLAELLKDL